MSTQISMCNVPPQRRAGCHSKVLGRVKAAWLDLGPVITPREQRNTGEKKKFIRK
jgi:hypothetical protein